MDELREKIAAVLLDVGLSDGWQGAEAEVADRILAIEEIDIALRYLAQQRQNGTTIFLGCTVEQGRSGIRPDMV